MIVLKYTWDSVKKYFKEIQIYKRNKIKQQFKKENNPLHTGHVISNFRFYQFKN